MVKTTDMKIYKDQKKVKEIGIKKKLERELEEILYKQITLKNDSEIGSYQIRRKSISRKDKGN